ncbi:MAG: DsrE family protein [Flavobacteriaceae bacterium]|nr:DsrE family protein [Flavobacteriaceae bacterium]MCB0474099.1 DsrE family protein [Flavobacteriaceae bacterium]
MKKILPLVLFMLFNGIMYAQFKGLIVDNYGVTYRVNPDATYDSVKNYKVLFDVYVDSEEHSKVNPQLTNIAEYLNKRLESGVSRDSLDIVVLFHGPATKDVLNDQAYLRFFKSENPNKAIIDSLLNEKADLMVCGQTYKGNAYNKDEKLPNVKMALSAAAVLAWYQSAGYHIINSI